LLLPLQLSSYYPYPVKTSDAIPIHYYFYLPVIIGIILLTYYSIRISKKIIFGIGFFTITVFLVLQLLPVGGAIMADRYSYIPSIGIFFIVAVGLSNIKSRAILTTILTITVILFSIKTYSQCSIWKNGMTLWN